MVVITGAAEVASPSAMMWSGVEGQRCTNDTGVADPHQKEIRLTAIASKGNCLIAPLNGTVILVYGKASESA